MPFKSEKQRRYMWANLPEIARKWSEKYGSKPKPLTEKQIKRAARERLLRGK